MKFSPEFRDAIANLPSAEKDTLILRLLKKDPDLANLMVKYSRSMKMIWSRIYYKAIEKHLIHETAYYRGIVIRSATSAKDGGCYIMGSFETDDYETHAVVSTLDKKGNLIW